MKRYHEEKHILENRAKKKKQLSASMDIWLQSLQNGQPVPVIETGRYRKTMRCGGCARPRCQLCHPDKYPKRIPTRKEKQTDYDQRNPD